MTPAHLASPLVTYGIPGLAAGVVAVITSPMVAALGPTEVNEWVTHAPFQTLPMVLVVAALAGHVIVFRRLAGRVTAGNP